MNKNINEELQSATFDRLLKHLDNRTLAIITSILAIFVSIRMGFRIFISRWYREEAEKKGVSISDLEAREHVYGMPYPKWKEKYQK